jgi:hypothetical protein
MDLRRDQRRRAPQQRQRRHEHQHQVDEQIALERRRMRCTQRHAVRRDDNKEEGVGAARP